MPICLRCRIEKPPQEFSLDNSRGNKRYPYCKQCVSIYLAEYTSRPKAEPNPNILRVCSACQIPQPLTEFYKDASKRDGYALQCKTCKRSTVKSYRSTNKDKVSASKLSWKKTDKGREAGRRHYHNHRDEYILASRERYRENPGLSAEKQRKWHIKNPEKSQAIIERANAKRQSLYRRAPLNDFTDGQFPAILKRYGYICVWCGLSSNSLEQDHVIPLSRGGPHTASNIVPACRSCNASRNNKMPWEWLVP